MKIEGIGIGETNQIRVRRGWLGTKIGAAATGDLVTKVVGNYNIINNSLTFAEAPFGNVPIVQLLMHLTKEIGVVYQPVQVSTEERYAFWCRR